MNKTICNLSFPILRSSSNHPSSQTYAGPKFQRNWPRHCLLIEPYYSHNASVVKWCRDCKTKWIHTKNFRKSVWETMSRRNSIKAIIDLIFLLIRFYWLWELCPMWIQSPLQCVAIYYIFAWYLQFIPLYYKEIIDAYEYADYDGTEMCLGAMIFIITPILFYFLYLDTLNKVYASIVDIYEAVAGSSTLTIHPHSQWPHLSHICWKNLVYLLSRTMPRNKQKQKKKSKKQPKKNNKQKSNNKQKKQQKQSKTMEKASSSSSKWKKCLLPSCNQQTDLLISGFIRNICDNSNCPMEIKNICSDYGCNILSVLSASQCQSLVHAFVERKIIKKKLKFKCIFNAKMDGFNAETFHSKCNEKGPTLIAVRSNFGLIFGGFTNISWKEPKGFSQYASDYDAFLFSFDSISDKLSVYDIEFNRAKLAIQNTKSKGPIFGYSDIVISDKSNIERTSFCKPSCYKVNGKGNVLCGGNVDSVSDSYFSFIVDNYEAFELK